MVGWFFGWLVDCLVCWLVWVGFFVLFWVGFFVFFLLLKNFKSEIIYVCLQKENFEDSHFLLFRQETNHGMSSPSSNKKTQCNRGNVMISMV